MRTAEAVTGGERDPRRLRDARRRSTRRSASRSGGCCGGSPHAARPFEAGARCRGLHERDAALTLPLVLILAGLAAYAVLGGADFGAGFWQLLGRPASERDGAAARARPPRDGAGLGGQPRLADLRARRLLDRATRRRSARSRRRSRPALHRGGSGSSCAARAYALRAATGVAHGEQRVGRPGLRALVDPHPFALGAAIGGIASGRVPVGNAEGDLFTSWLNPTSIARRRARGRRSPPTSPPSTWPPTRSRLGGRSWPRRSARERSSMARRRRRVALAGLVVVRHDARPIWDGLTSGCGLAAVVVSALARRRRRSLLVWRRRYGAGARRPRRSP